MCIAARTYLERREEFRGVVNAAHIRETAKVLRVEGDDLKPRAFSVWAPIALAGIQTS